MDQKIIEWIYQNRINFLDPFFIFISDTASFFAYAVPLILLFIGFYKRRRDLKIYGTQLLTAILSSTVLVTIIKNIVRRQRPFEMDKLIQKLSSGGGYSFPSGHTADAIVMATSITLIIIKNKWILIPVWLWALSVAFSRMALGVHFLSDIIGACFIAVFCAFLMDYLFKSLHKSQLNN